MNEPQGRSQIVRTVSAQLAGTRKLQSLTATSSSHKRTQTISGQSEILQSTTGQLAADAIPTGLGEKAESAEVLGNIKALL